MEPGSTAGVRGHARARVETCRDDQSSTRERAKANATLDCSRHLTVAN